LQKFGAVQGVDVTAKMGQDLVIDGVLCV